MNLRTLLQDPSFTGLTQGQQIDKLKELGAPPEVLVKFAEKYHGGRGAIGADTNPSMNSDPSNFVGDPGEFGDFDYLKGGLKSLGQTARGLTGLVAGEQNAERLIPRAAVTMENPHQAQGGQMEQGAELMLANPERLVASLPGAASTLGKTALTAATGAGIGYGLGKGHGQSEGQAAFQGVIGAIPGLAPIASRAATGLMASRLKNFMKLLGVTAKDAPDAVRLAERVSTEGLAAPGSNYADLVNRSSGLRNEAGQAVESFIDQNAGMRIPTKPILNELDAMAPAKLPGGEMPSTGRNLQQAYKSVRSDAEKAMIGMEPQVATPAESKLGQTFNNASGESDASMEAINRLKSMQRQKQKYVIFDRSGNMRPVIGADAVDQGMRLNKGETFGILSEDGSFVNLADKGGKVPPRGAGNPAVTGETEAEKLARWQKLGIVPPPPKVAPAPQVPETIPLGGAVGERRRLDALLNYDRAIPASSQYIKGNADAYRHALNEVPGFKDINLRDSELITINDMLKQQEALSHLPVSAEGAAGAAGAGLVGRPSIPAMFGARWFARQPGWQTLSAEGKLLLAKLLNNSAAASRFVATGAQIKNLGAQ